MRAPRPRCASNPQAPSHGNQNAPNPAADFPTFATNAEGGMSGGMSASDAEESIGRGGVLESEWLGCRAEVRSEEEAAIAAHADGVSSRRARLDGAAKKGDSASQEPRVPSIAATIAPIPAAVLASITSPSPAPPPANSLLVSADKPTTELKSELELTSEAKKDAADAETQRECRFVSISPPGGFRRVRLFVVCSVLIGKVSLLWNYIVILSGWIPQTGDPSSHVVCVLSLHPA
ncbi:hypothetical protein K438DRAFT_2008580 [Mycena galopus ATCC 62051]|nr:hypothetical protein K438DRAFT_2008580 [Mycena galopus ATCC 62051]